MDIKEMQQYRTELEARLRNVAGEIVDEFQRRTGLLVTSVSVDLIDETPIGGRPRAIVTAAHIRVDL